ncbi:CopG family transcriptional regulator [Archaeoglobales archaeon]|nr:MAG: CopG family transcriptional regulator [Archaeoglobales archaeon]
MANNDKYRTIRLPKDLVAEIEELIKDKSLGYVSKADFVKDAVRRRLEELKKMKKSKK